MRFSTLSKRSSTRGWRGGRRQRTGSRSARRWRRPSRAGKPEARASRPTPPPRSTSGRRNTPTAPRSSPQRDRRTLAPLSVTWRTRSATPLRQPGRSWQKSSADQAIADPEPARALAEPRRGSATRETNCEQHGADDDAHAVAGDRRPDQEPETADERQQRADGTGRSGSYQPQEPYEGANREEGHARKPYRPAELLP